MSEGYPSVPTTDAERVDYIAGWWIEYLSWHEKSGEPKEIKHLCRRKRSEAACRIHAATMRLPPDSVLWEGRFFKGNAP